MNMSDHPGHPPLPRPKLRFALLAASGFALGVGSAAAQAPRGGVVARGSARISQTAAQSTITQTSLRATINWQGFDVGPTHTVVFDQPGRAAATLNRVNSVNRSVIEGAIRAPGTVVIQNTAGVIFTGTAKVDVGGLVATSQTVNIARFDADGSLRMGDGDLPGASVINQGEITIGEAGLAALIGGHVENAGAIVASKGVVALNSGKQTTIDLSGDGTLRIVTTGNPDAGSSIVNSGSIDVGEGRVLMSAGNAVEVLDNAINTTGVIRATSATGTGGTVELLGRGRGRIRVAGTVDVSGQRGGSINSTGETVAVETGARLASRGQVDGGEIHLGGDHLINAPLRRTQHLTIDRGAEIAVDGATGAGGTALLVAGGNSAIDGAISATGGASGGSVETFARYALAIGDNASVTVGAGGSWLINPHNPIIDDIGIGRAPDGTILLPDFAPYAVNGRVVGATLDGGADVTVSSFQPVFEVPGDITVLGTLAWSGPGNLSFAAARDIAISGTVRSDGAGDFVAAADRDISSTGAILSTTDADLTLTAARNLSFGGTIRASGAGDVALTASTGDVAARGPGADILLSTNSGTLGVEATQGALLLGRADAGSNSLRLYSDHGDVDLTAGTRILARGGAGAGAWTRIGDGAAGGALRLHAPEIAIEGGDDADAFAEVTAGAGGAITIGAANRIATRDNASGALGRVVALNGATLDMQAPTQLWNGLVRSGDGGSVLVSGAITAGVGPVFDLAPGAGFTLAFAAPDGTLSSFASDRPLSVHTSGTGTIDIDAPVSAASIELISAERVRLGSRAHLTGTGAGDSLVLAAGRSFVNEAGAAPLEATNPAGRWLLYLDAFDGISGAKPASGGYNLYSRAYAAAPPPTLAGFSGNRVVYGATPTLTVTAGSGKRMYGGALANLGTNVTGYRPGDDASTALTGAPVTGSAGNTAAAAAGTYATNALATASAQGYALVFVAGKLRVDTAALIVTANGARRKYGGDNPTFTAHYSGFVLGEDVGDLRGKLRCASGAGDYSHVGTYRITASGLSSSNYSITYVDGALAVDPAPLTVTAENSRRSFGAANPSFAARYDGFVNGEREGVLRGTLNFRTGATGDSPAGLYRVRPGGYVNGDYVISYVDGALLVTPRPSAISAAADVNALTRPFVRGVPPYTPGDASFRTTQAEAPPALSNPFALTYSLGDVVRLTPEGGAPAATATGSTSAAGGFVAASGGGDDGTDGFVPASGGEASGVTSAGDGCDGSVNQGAADVCARATFPELFWFTSGGAL